MTDWHTAANTLRSHFNTEWGNSSHSGVPIFWDNMPGFTPPQDGSAYVGFVVDPSDSNLVCLAGAPNRKVRKWGIAMVSVHIPTQTGTKTAEELIKTVVDIMTLKKLANGVETYEAVPSRVGKESEQDPWVHHNVRTEFYFESQH